MPPFFSLLQRALAASKSDITNLQAADSKRSCEGTETLQMIPLDGAMVRAVDRSTWQQHTSSNHSFRLQSSPDSLHGQGVQSGGAASALAALLGRVEELEAQQNASKTAIAAVQLRQEDLLQAVRDCPTSGPTRQEQWMKHCNESWLESEVSDMKRNWASASTEATEIKQEQSDMHFDISVHGSKLTALEEQQAAQLSSIAAIKGAQEEAAADSKARLELLTADLAEMKVTDKMMAELRALGNRQAHAEATMSAGIAEHSELQSKQLQLAEDLSATKELIVTMTSEMASLGSQPGGLRGTHASSAASLERTQAGLVCTPETVGELQEAVKEATAAALDARQRAGSVDGMQEQLCAWTASVEALAADHELAAAETTRALQVMAHISTDNKALQNTVLELRADCDSQHTKLTQLGDAVAQISAAARLVRLPFCRSGTNYLQLT